MATLVISESGLDFTFESSNLFLPEREGFYPTLASAGAKICDMIYLSSSGELWFIEVKSSSPRENRDFVRDIKQKFVDSILIFIGTLHNRKNTAITDVPDFFHTNSPLQSKIRLVLIVKGHQLDWLPPLRDSLRKECRALERLFSLEETQVYNEQLASSKLGLSVVIRV